MKEVVLPKLRMKDVLGLVGMDSDKHSILSLRDMGYSHMRFVLQEYHDISTEYQKVSTMEEPFIAVDIELYHTKKKEWKIMSEINIPSDVDVNPFPIIHGYLKSKTIPLDPFMWFGYYDDPFLQKIVMENHLIGTEYWNDMVDGKVI